MTSDGPQNNLSVVVQQKNCKISKHYPWKPVFIKGALPSKSHFNPRSSSIKVCLSFQFVFIVFHLWVSSSIKDNFLSKVVFQENSSCALENSRRSPYHLVLSKPLPAYHDRQAGRHRRVEKATNRDTSCRSAQSQIALYVLVHCGQFETTFLKWQNLAFC